VSPLQEAKKSGGVDDEIASLSVAIGCDENQEK
jgi:hypothetical protein